MELTENQIATIIQCGTVGFNYRDTSAIVGLDENEVKEQFISEKGNVYEAWRKGRLQTELNLRNSMLRAAQDGAAPMVEKVLRFLNRTDEDHRDLFE